MRRRMLAGQMLLAFMIVDPAPAPPAAAPPPAIVPEPGATPPKGPAKAPPVALSVRLVDALAGIAEVSPAASRVAEVLGLGPGELARAIKAAEGRGLAESWVDDYGTTRLMLSADEATTRGLALDRTGRTWVQRRVG